MEIRIVKPADQDILEETFVRWHLAAKKNFKAIAMYATASCIYFLLGWWKIKRTGTFWNFYICMALSLIIVILNSVYSLYKGRQKWIARAKFCIDRQIKLQTQTEFIFNDTGFTSCDAEARVEIKWSAFSHYTIYKNYVFLYLSYSEVGVSHLIAQKWI